MRTALVIFVHLNFWLVLLRTNGNKSGKDRRKHEDNIVTETAISDPPGLLGIAAFVLFFAGTLVGPQFPLARFRAFVN
ncbi:hypothetical protein niasHT_028662 [Heterodera trifolii]|uniref:Uncharacterized protein n=1 Tax=Heterodera trifolii TaxID=157864 RepID=A0ABD2K0K0_9BILA